jgi:hypothetical protein
MLSIFTTLSIILKVMWEHKSISEKYTIYVMKEWGKAN